MKTALAKKRNKSRKSAPPYKTRNVTDIGYDPTEIPYRFTGKELDTETGLYYYGARYLDPKTSRWLSGDPALGEYLPSAPVNDEARKRNGNLPGQGGVFNLVNLHVYHYAGNNPVKYVDPDGNSNSPTAFLVFINYKHSWGMIIVIISFLFFLVIVICYLPERL